jgi:hypothetical protein
MAYPIGIRLNNPGNINHSEANEWQGATRLQDDKRIVRFKNPQYGIRALIKVLISYKELHDCETIVGIIRRYAPPHENNTNSYINDVSGRTGFFPNEILDMQDTYTLVRLAQAIVIHENGLAPIVFPAAWYEEEIYIEAVKDALSDED